MKLHGKETVRVTLHYLHTGDSQVTIGTSYRISPTAIGRIISETCRVIWYVPNKKGFIKAPTSKKEWLDIAIEFDSKWNFPHCLGDIDGKQFFNYFTFFNYKKSIIDKAGRQSDGGIYSNSKLRMAIDRNLLYIPEPTAINEYSVTKKISVCFCCR